MKRLFALTILAAAAAAQAGMGNLQLPGTAGDAPVTVFYPTAAADQPQQRGPFTVAMAPGAEPAKGNGHLVVISHGSGGNPWVHTDLARQLVNAGYVVAMPQHKGDNAFDTSAPGPDSFKLRPGEVSHAIDSVAQDKRFAALDFKSVGMYGMSAGGHTALSLAGGQWSPGNYRRHCEESIADDFNACVGLATQLTGGALDGMKKSIALSVIRSRYDDDTLQRHTDPRIKAIVAGVPYSADFDVASLARPAVPLGLVTARRDKWLVPQFHSDRVLAACKGCELIADLPTAGHGALMSPPVPSHLLGEVGRAMMDDPPGFDRSQMAAIDSKIVAFFGKHLLP